MFFLHDWWHWTLRCKLWRWLVKQVYNVHKPVWLSLSVIKHVLSCKPPLHFPTLRSTILVTSGSRRNWVGLLQSQIRLISLCSSSFCSWMSVELISEDLDQLRQQWCVTEWSCLNVWHPTFPQPSNSSLMNYNSKCMLGISTPSIAMTPWLECLLSAAYMTMWSSKHWWCLFWLCWFKCFRWRHEWAFRKQ